MAEHPAAPLLAADLGRLPHTNKRGEQGIVQLPGFATSAGMAEEQSADVGLLALAIAEAVIEDLTKHGYPPTAKADIDARIAKAAAKAETGPNELVLHCNRCRQPVLKVDISAPAPKLHVTVAVMALAAHREQCR